MFAELCGSVTGECEARDLNVLADFDDDGRTGSIVIPGSDSIFEAVAQVDGVNPFRSLVSVERGGAIHVLSIHRDGSAAFTYHTGLEPGGAIWSSATGQCEELS